MYFVVLYCDVFCCFVLRSTVVYCTLFHFTFSFCTVEYFIMFDYNLCIYKNVVSNLVIISIFCVVGYISNCTVFFSTLTYCFSVSHLFVLHSAVAYGFCGGL